MRFSIPRPTRRRSWLAALTIICAPFWACHDQPTAPRPYPAASQGAQGDAQVGVVGTALPQPLLVVVTDREGQPIAGVTVTFRVASGGGSVGAASATTDDAGRVQATWTLGGTAGTQQVDAVVEGLPLVKFTATAKPDQPASIQFIPDSLSFDALGDSARLAVSARDRFNNDVTGTALTWSTSDTLVAAVDLSGRITSRGNGQARVIAASSGRADTARITVAQRGVTFAIAAGQRTINAIGDTLTLAVAWRDRNGFTAPATAGAPPAWTLSEPTVATLSGGGVLVSSGVGQTRVIARSGAASDSTVVIVRQVIAAVTLVPPGTLAAGTQQQLQATAVDSNGVTATAATFSWQSTDTAIAKVDAAGQVLVRKAGAAEIVVGTPELPGGPVRSARSTITVVAGDPASLSVVSGDLQGATAATPLARPLIVRAMDAYGNPTLGRPVQWSVLAGGGSVTPATDSVGADGLATAQLTVGGSAGTNTVQALVGALTATFSAEAGNQIGASGGAVSVPNNAAAIAIPAGAVAGGTELTITPLNLADIPTDPTLVPGTSFEFGPSMHFNTPVQVTLKFDPALIPAGTTAGELKLHRLTNGTWQEMTGNVVDLTTNTVTAPLSSFSTYALLRERPVFAMHAALDTIVLTSTGATHTISITLLDVLNRALDGRLLRYTSADTSVATVSSQGVVTAAGSGTTTVTVRFGILSVNVAVRVAQTASTVEVTPPAPSLSALGATQQLTAIAFDASHSVVNGSTFVWTTSDAAVATVSSTGLVTAVSNGTATITATSGSIAGTATVTVQQAAASMVAQAGDAQSATVQNDVAIAPAVIVRDANGLPIAGVSVTFTVASGGGSVTGSPAITGVDGIATVGNWTLGAAAGANGLTASVGALTVNFAATGTIGIATTLTKTTGDAQTAVAGTAVAIAPTVHLVDAQNNPVPGTVVTFSVTTGGGSVTVATPTTDASGNASVGSWTLGNLAGANTLTASVGTLTAIFSATGTVGAASSISKSAGDAQSATVATAVGIVPQVLITDSHANPVAGVSVTFTVASGGGSITGATATTDASGVASVGSWTLGSTVGTNTLTATAGLSSTTFSATGTVGAASIVSKNAGDAQSAAVATAVAVAPQILVTDSHANPVAGVSVTFTVASGGGSVTGATAITDASGFAAVGSWTLGTAPGANALTATAAGTLTATFSATATAGAPANIANNAGDAQSATVATTVGIAPRVLITDSHANPVAGVNVTFTVASGGGSVTGGTTTTDASGLASVGSWTLGNPVGANTLTATAGLLTTTFSATGTVGAASVIGKNAGDAQSATVATAVAVAPQVLITDSHANPVAGVSVTFTVASGGGSVTGATAMTDASGFAAVGSWTLGTAPGANTLTATAGTLTVTFSATATAGAPANIANNAGDAQSATVATAVGIAPAVLITDSHANPVAGVSVTFTVASGGGGVTGGTTTTDANGLATVGSWTLGSTVGANTLTATAGLLNTTFTATGTVGAAANISKNAGDAQTATVGTAVAIAPRVLITDSHTNPVAGVSVTFTVASGGGSLTGATTTTDASGFATVGSWTLGTTPGANTLTATAGLLTATFTAGSTAGAPANIVKNAGDAQSATAGTAVAIAPVVLVTDSHGNPLEGVAVTFSVASGGGSVTGATQVTDANGLATVGSWTLGNTVGANTLTVTAGLLNATFTATGTVGAAANIAKNAGDAQSATVGLAVATAPKVLITDSHANAVAGVSVTFTVASGGGSVTGATVTTDASGFASVGSWTLGTTVGANTLTATAGLLSTTFSATGTVGAASVISKNAGDAQSATVATAVAIAPQVLITDSHANPVPGVSVTFTVASGGGSVTGATTTTDASGLASVSSWTLGNSVGANTLTATAGLLTTTFTATGTVGAAANISKNAGDAQSATVATGVAIAPTVLITDSHANPVAGVSVTFTVASGGGSVTGATATTDASGFAAVGSWTLGTTVGANTLTATAGLLSTTFSATGTVGTASIISKSAGDAQSATVATAVAIAPQVLITDSHANPVAGVSVTFTVASGGGSVTGGTTTTDASGLASVGSWTLGGTVGTNTLTATAGLLTTTFSATGTVGTASIISKDAGDAQSATAGFAVATAPQVLITDSHGNPVSGVGVTFTIASGGGSLTGGTQITDASGLASVGSWTLGTTVGANTLTATAGLLTTTFSATGTPGAVASYSVTSTGGGAIATQTAGTPFNVRITALDANGNTATGFTGTVDVTSNRTGTAGLTQSAAFVNGVLSSHSVTLTTPTGSGATITATRTGGTEAGTSAAFTLNSGGVHHFVVDAAGGGGIGTQTAGTPFNIRVTAQDASNNIVTGFTGTVNITSNRAGTSGLTTTAAFSAGVLASHSITLSQSGTLSTITATRTSGGTETGTSNSFTVNPGALHHFAVEAAGGGSIATQTAGTPFNIQVTAQDAFNNVATSFTGTVVVSSNRTGSAGLTTSAAFTAGVLASHSVTLTTPTGSGATITATNSAGAESGTSTAFALNAGAVTHFRVEAAGGGVIATQTAGTPFSVRVTALDANDNTATGFTGTVDVTSNRTGASGLTTSASFVAGVLASHSVTLTTPTGAGATITATRSGGAETGTSTAFTLGAGALDHFRVEAAGGGAIATQAAGTPFNVQFTAQDAFNNTVTSFTGAVVVSSNRTGIAGLTTSAAFTAGTLASHSVTLTTPLGAGATITATRSGGTETGTSTAFTLVAGAVHHFVVEAQGGGNIGTHGAAVPFNIQITAQDVGNNTATSFTGTVDVTSNRTGTAGLTTSAAFTAGVLASHSVTLTQTGAGATITATRTGGTEAGTSNTFTIGTPPSVTTTTPANNAFNVARNATITVNFSASVNATLASFALECPAGSGRVFTLSASPATSFTLTPSAPMPGGTTCQVTVNAAQVTDAVTSAPMASNSVFSFETQPGGTNETYPQSVIGNVSVNSGNIPFSVTTNDVSTNPITITAFDATTAQGGQVSMTTSGGSIGQFTYNPPAGYHGPNDTFTYTITTASGSSATATVTMPINGMVWFVDANAGVDGDGRLSNPFNALQSFNAINNGVGNHPAANDNIFLYSSGTSYTGPLPLTLLNGQKLIGQGATAQLQTITGLTVPSGSAAFPTTFGGTTTIAGASGGVVLAAGASASIHGLTIATTGGTALASAASFGTLSISNASGETPDVTINASGGGAINLTSGAVNGTFTSVTSTGGTNAINLVLFTGSLTSNGGALSGASGPTVNISGSTAGSLTYRGTVTQTGAARLVTIANHTGGVIDLQGNLSCTSSCTGISASNNTGGTILFSGPSKTLTTATNKAVTLANNTGATVSFTGGGLAINTTSGNGFEATGGGTVSVIGAGNTITTTATGTALNVQSSTIGAAGLTFQSINSTGAGGTPANAIFLSSTGSLGGLAVTGTSGICTRTTTTCTGGVIGSTSGSSGTPAGIGIYLSNTRNVSLNRMRINGTHQNFGIYGTAVNGLTLGNVLMDGTYGDNVSTSFNEGALSLDELAGTATVSNSYFAGGALNNVRLHNTSASAGLTSLTFSSDTIGFTNATGDDGLQVVLDAGSPTISVVNSSFLGAVEVGAEFAINGGSPTINFNGNQMVNTHPNESAQYNHIRLIPDGDNSQTGTINYSISGNVLNGSNQAPITIEKRRGQWQMVGTISSNTIGNAGSNSGSLNGNGININHVSQGKHRVLVSSNTVSQYNGVAGFNASVTANTTGAPSDGSMHITLTGNTFSNPGNNTTSYRDAVHFDAVTDLSGSNYTMCVNLGAGGSNNLANGYTLVPDGQAISGAPYSVGNASTASYSGNAFLKVLNLAGGPFTGNAGQTALNTVWSAANVPGTPTDPFNTFLLLHLNGLNYTTTSTANGVGVNCELP